MYNPHKRDKTISVTSKSRLQSRVILWQHVAGPFHAFPCGDGCCDIGAGYEAGALDHLHLVNVPRTIGEDLRDLNLHHELRFGVCGFD